MHIYNVNGPVHDLATTVAKFLHLGLSLEDAIAKVTSVPAQVMGMADAIGTLKVGAWGDAVVLAVEEGSFPLADSAGVTRTGRRMLSPRVVIRQGQRYTHR